AEDEDGTAEVAATLLRQLEFYQVSVQRSYRLNVPGDGFVDTLVPASADRGLTFTDPALADAWNHEELPAIHAAIRHAATGDGRQFEVAAQLASITARPLSISGARDEAPLLELLAEQARLRGERRLLCHIAFRQAISRVNRNEHLEKRALELLELCEA